MVKLTDYRVNNLHPSPTDRLSSEQSLTKDQFVIALGMCMAVCAHCSI